MANPVRLNETQNRLWLAHCTVPRKIIDKYILRSHFESRLSLGIQGILSLGPVTILRIGGKDMDKIWIAEGNVIRSGKSEELCRTQVEIQLIEGCNVGDLLRSPLGNHLILLKGYHMLRLKEWWNRMI